VVLALVVRVEFERHFVRTLGWLPEVCSRFWNNSELSGHKTARKQVATALLLRIPPQNINSITSSGASRGTLSGEQCLQRLSARTASVACHRPRCRQSSPAVVGFRQRIRGVARIICKHEGKVGNSELHLTVKAHENQRNQRTCAWKQLHRDEHR
jgi:hypothetical protein